MIEAALYVIGEKDYDMTRVDYAVQSFEGWYAGDGVYGDWYRHACFAALTRYAGDGVYGDEPNFHWDYYNSFVIHPMYLDVLRTFQDIRQD